MRRAKSLRKKMNEVDAFAAARNLPVELRNALTGYYNDAWMAHEGKPGLHLPSSQPCNCSALTPCEHSCSCHWTCAFGHAPYNIRQQPYRCLSRDKSIDSRLSTKRV